MNKRNIGLVFGVAIVLLVCYFTLSSVGVDDSYSGEYILANKVYMNDGSINIVIYFNVSSGTHYLIFEDWDAKHSVTLSNLDVGDNIKVTYRDIILGPRTIIGIEVIE